MNGMHRPSHSFEHFDVSIKTIFLKANETGFFFISSAMLAVMLIKIEASHSIESVTKSGAILGLNQCWMTILEETAMGMWCPRSAIRNAVHFTWIECFECSLLRNDRFNLFVVWIIWVAIDHAKMHTQIHDQCNQKTVLSVQHFSPFNLHQFLLPIIVSRAKATNNNQNQAQVTNKFNAKTMVKYA